MANDPIQNEYPLPKENYAAFDAISLRNLIIQRMNDQGIFTDQNYIGSNLASIIDIISYAYNTLIYYLNRTSNESTFTEAQLYENISRIVKLLDYKPIGYQTSTLAFQCSAIGLTQGEYTIPKYSYLMVGNIPFSFNEDVSFNSSNQVEELTDLSNRKLLYQGIYREAPIYTAAGDANEIVTINTPNIQIDHFNIDVYVKEKSQNRWIQYKNVSNLYSEQAFSRSFEKRLNSNLLYEITFGDGITGRRLEQGDQVAIYYLQSSGDNGIIGPGVLTENTSNVVYSTTLYEEIKNQTNTQGLNYIESSQFANIAFNNIVGSTVPKNIETADEIRKNAPANFKSQYRLVTKEDIETFIKINFANFINDAKVFSNWDYTSRYLKYFNDINISPAGYRQILLNQVLYADSCNFNNIYVCCVPKVSQGSSLKYLLPAQKEIILSNILPLKTLTTEIIFMDPIFKAISLGTKTNGDFVVADRDFCRLEIVKTPTNRRTNRSIINEVANVFKTFFNPINSLLGGTFDYQSLVASILVVDGVSRIRTRRVDTNEFVEGLSLFVWNPTYADLDKKTVVSNVQLEDFEFLYFDDLSNINTKIDIIEETTALQ